MTGNYYVQSSSSLAGLGGLSKFTITGWVNVKNSTEGGGGNRIVSWINNGGDGVDLVYKSDGSLMMSVDQWPDGLSTRSNAAKLPTSSTGSNSNWRFFAASYDSTISTDNVKFYFGSTTANVAFDKAITYNRGTVGTNIGKLAIGHFNDATRSAALDRMFRGMIDEIQIYNTALSIDELQVIKSNQNLAIQTSPAPSITCPTGLFVAQYFPNINFSGTPLTTRCESATSINYDWADAPPLGLPNNKYSAVWSGTFNFATTKNYTFNANADDAVRVYVDGALLINSWSIDGYKTNQATKLLGAGKHTVRVEYIENVENSKVSVNWL